jgi:hypothetical protein
MKILTIRQPYAQLIVTGQKPIENRTWGTRYRGPLLIHAAYRMHDDPIEEIELRLDAHVDRSLLQLGGVIGCAELVDVVTEHPSRSFEGPFGFVLSNCRELPFTAWKGGLGLRNAPPELLLQCS